MFVSYYWITEKRKNRSSCHILEPILWAVIWSVLQTTPNPDSNPQTGLWVPNVWMKCAGRGLPRVMRWVQWNTQSPILQLLGPAWPSPTWPHWTHALCSLSGPVYVSNWTDFFNQNNAALFISLSICQIQINLKLRCLSTIRLKHTKKAFTSTICYQNTILVSTLSLKWIYSCLRWQINSVSSVARCLASHLWGNHKPLGR